MKIPIFKSGKPLIILVALGVLCIASVVLTLTIGPTATPLGALFENTTAAMIVWNVRLPRILVAFMVGCGLAAAGTAMQGLFRNSMADPYIIGTSYGGAVGAVVAIVLLGGTGKPILAFIGASAATFIVYALAMYKGRAPVETLLLSGIAFSMFLSAIVTFFMSIAGESLHQIVFWLMGGFWTISWEHIPIALLIPAGCVALYAFSRDINILSVGEEDAVHLGVDVELLKKILLFLTSFITGIAVSLAGVIGFIGLITPHIMRLIIGPDHRFLLPAAMLAGGLFLLWSDTLARTITNDLIPVGVVTAFFGAPFFIYLLRRRLTA
jgi:iron complex transport system permease protein